MDVLALPDSAQYPNQQVVVGFGFSSMGNDYKVVKIVYYSHRGSIRPSGGNLPQSSVEILSLRSLTWRSLGEIPYQIFGKRPSQVLVNGRLNWATWPIYRCSSARLIFSFDLSEEKFYEVPRSDCGSLDKFNHNLVVLGGCLSASVYRKDGYFEIWVMKEYNVKESWINLYNIDIMDESFENSGLHLKRSYARVICLLKNGETYWRWQSQERCSVLIQNLKPLSILHFMDYQDGMKPLSTWGVSTGLTHMWLLLDARGAINRGVCPSAPSLFLSAWYLLGSGSVQELLFFFLFYFYSKIA